LTRLLLVGLLLSGLAGVVPAADLSTVDRGIVKEPLYSARVKYCLLVFGKRAEIRVWLVLDDRTLYVDRNADGDVTGPEKKVDGQQHPQILHALLFKTGPLSAKGLPKNTR